MNILEQHRKFQKLDGKTQAFCRKLAELKASGKTNEEMEAFIQSLNLPFGLHMFITGNFSELMDYFGGTHV